MKILNAILLLGLAGCVDSQGASVNDPGLGSRECLYLNRVDGFSSAGRGRIFVHAGVRDTYEFEVFGVCPELDYSFNLQLRNRSGTPTACRGTDVDLVIPVPNQSPQVCGVQMIRKLSPEEATEARRGRRGS